MDLILGDVPVEVFGLRHPARLGTLMIKSYINAGMGWRNLMLHTKGRRLPTHVRAIPLM